jgi:hypothetical protein
MKLIFAILILASITKPGYSQYCNIYCDGRNPELSVDSRVVLTTELFGRTISLHVSDSDNMGFAEISNGDATDKIWLDRSFDGGVSWPGKLGEVVIPTGSRYLQTID